MPKKSAMKLLGRSENKLPDEPSTSILDVFPNRTPSRNYTIHLSAPEFSSLCPVTGQPDSAHLEICYVPDKLCVETKSLKFYLAAYRNQPAFNEVIVNRVLDDLVKICKPRQAVVRGKFSPRGGIQLTCEAHYPDRNKTGPLPLLPSPGR